MNALAKEHRIRKTWKELWDGVQKMTPAQPSLVCHMTLYVHLKLAMLCMCTHFVQISSENKFLVTHGQILHKRTTMAVLIKVTAPHSHNAHSSPSTIDRNLVAIL